MELLKTWSVGEDVFIKVCENNKNKFYRFNEFNNKFDEIKYKEFVNFSYEVINEDVVINQFEKMCEQLCWELQCDATICDIY